MRKLQRLRSKRTKTDRGQFWKKSARVNPNGPNLCIIPLTCFFCGGEILVDRSCGVEVKMLNPTKSLIGLASTRSTPQHPFWEELGSLHLISRLPNAVPSETPWEVPQPLSPWPPRQPGRCHHKENQQDGRGTSGAWMLPVFTIPRWSGPNLSL